MSCLSDIKMLNLMMLTTIKAGQRAVEPPMMLPDDSMIREMDTEFGAVMYYRTTQPGVVPTPYEGRNKFNIALEQIEQTREAVKKAFYADLFALLIDNQENDKTKFETQKLLDERQTIFAPTWGRMQPELFNVSIERGGGNSS